MADGQRDGPTVMGRREFAKRLKVSTHRVDRWLDEGMPHLVLDGPQGRVLIDFGEAWQWVVKKYGAGYGAAEGHHGGDDEQA
ncbi:MAG: hypothetical protein D6812_15355 [Deltaproteobacteria bacterium]|nr:MAG: hypothetical protein D6812_15355 [Deltaproteobacteria bacterium]